MPIGRTPAHSQIRIAIRSRRKARRISVPVPVIEFCRFDFHRKAGFSWSDWRVRKRMLNARAAVARLRRVRVKTVVAHEQLLESRRLAQQALNASASELAQDFVEPLGVDRASHARSFHD